MSGSWLPPSQPQVAYVSNPIKGDSGGALYRWFDNPGTNERRAYALGIVSRGYECGLKDEAGIYTR